MEIDAAKSSCRTLSPILLVLAVVLFIVLWPAIQTNVLMTEGERFKAAISIQDNVQAVVAGQDDILALNQYLERREDKLPADVQIRYRGGSGYSVTPLMYVAQFGTIRQLERLLSIKPNTMKQTDADGNTALHWASGFMGLARHTSQGLPLVFPEKVELLVKAGSDVDAQNRNKTTPLMIAARFSQPAIVEILVNAGANVNAADADGMTALHFASLSRAIDVVELLRQSGADLNATDRDGRTARRIAKSSNWLPGEIERVFDVEYDDASALQK